MKWIDDLNRERSGGAVGQVTQFVVGAANESDREVFQRIDQLYGDWNLKRVYYSNFQPIPYTPLEEHPPTSMTRSHRLYQMDWLKRIYKFSNEEIGLAFDESGYLSMDTDPKSVIALENLDAFPVDINYSTKAQMLRVPGLGPTAAERILRQRRIHTVDSWRDLQAMGVIKKRAWPYLVFSGHRPPKAKQLRMELFRSPVPQPRSTDVAGLNLPQAAPCGSTRTCTGCPLYGQPDTRVPKAQALRYWPESAEHQPTFLPHRPRGKGGIKWARTLYERNKILIPQEEEARRAFIDPQ